MFGRYRDRTDTERTRGGIAWLPILTGMVVALGAMLLLSGAVGAFLVVIDALPPDRGEVAELGIGGSIALVIGLFLSYLWGGYTAGRMARGAGVRTGLLVAVVALLVALAAAGAARAADLTTNLNVPFTSDRLPIEEEVIVDWGVLLGLVSLAAMALGSAYGGYRGVKWHTDLEDKTREKERAEAEAEKPEQPPLEEPESSGIHLSSRPPATAPEDPATETSAEEGASAETVSPDEETPGHRSYR